MFSIQLKPCNKTATIQDMPNWQSALMSMCASTFGMHKMKESLRSLVVILKNFSHWCKMGQELLFMANCYAFYLRIWSIVLEVLSKTETAALGFFSTSTLCNFVWLDGDCVRQCCLTSLRKQTVLSHPDMAWNQAESHSFSFFSSFIHTEAEWRQSWVHCSCCDNEATQQTTPQLATFLMRLMFIPSLCNPISQPSLSSLKS